MKVELELPDTLVQAIAERVAVALKPHIAARKPEPPDAIMTPEQLSKYLQVTRQWIYERVSLGEIPRTRVGKYLRFRKSAIDRWLEDQSAPATSPLSRRLGAAK